MHSPDTCEASNWKGNDSHRGVVIVDVDDRLRMMDMVNLRSIPEITDDIIFITMHSAVLNTKLKVVYHKSYKDLIPLKDTLVQIVKATTWQGNGSARVGR